MRGTTIEEMRLEQDRRRTRGRSSSSRNRWRIHPLMPLVEGEYFLLLMTMLLEDALIIITSLY